GEHVYMRDYGKLLAYHVSLQADCTVGCVEVALEEATAFGVLAVDESLRITEFQEKPKDPKPMPGKPDIALASMGIYVFNAAFLYEQLIRDADDPRSDHDFGKNIVPHLIGRYRVFAHRLQDSCVNMVEGEPYWRDVGTVDAYWEANIDLTTISPQLNLYDKEWPIWTHQEQLPPAKFVFDEEGRRGAAVDSMVSGGCLISGSTIRRSLLFSDVRVHSYCNIEDAVILPNVTVQRRAVLKKVVVDRRCVIPEGLVVGVNPDDDRRRFYVTDKGVTLITPEMLGQPVHQVR
ncbi:MAG TPA: sugar phosphate nucleotidyltransferase, partial [Pelomicrobium sp.]|nr:sugar phosphate nucleotidyltransferase [Pelomicrobium sp.]